MIGVYILFFAPLLLFVTAFLYETYISFVRLKGDTKKKANYLSATWELTHTLLVFSVVMLVMLFTKSLDQLSSRIFMTTLIAATFLGVRGVLYIYLFYVRSHDKINWIDWCFAISHIATAFFLIATVVNAILFFVKDNPVANSQFVPYFIPGLIAVGAVCLLPLTTLYANKK